MSEKTALVLVASGTEEMELVISVDVLRRSGVNVTVAGVDGHCTHTCSRNVMILPDTSLSKAISSGPYDLIVLPGGLKGSEIFSQSKEVGDLLKGQELAGRFIGAICAAPLALKAHGIGLKKSITSYPSVRDQLEESYTYAEERVVVDGKLITSRGPGTAFDFALKLCEILEGNEKASEVMKALLLR